MRSQEIIKNNWATSEKICTTYLEDLNDADLMQRPHTGCNHLNWQLGHLILSEHSILSGYAPDRMPPLPEGFVDKYGKEKVGSDNSEEFLTKAELLQTYRTQREAAIAILADCSDDDFDADAPEAIRSFAPTVGAMMSMLGNHWLMHCGQWVIVRRTLGKPIVI